MPRPLSPGVHAATGRLSSGPFSFTVVCFEPLLQMLQNHLAHKRPFPEALSCPTRSRAPSLRGKVSALLSQDGPGYLYKLKALAPAVLELTLNSFEIRF